MEEAYAVQNGNIVDQNVNNTSHVPLAHHCFLGCQVALLRTTNELLNFM
jgi:hypothetical protein